MIKVDPGVQVESIALQEVKIHPTLGNSAAASIQLIYYMEINGTVCGPCGMQIETASLPDEDRATAIFLEYIEGVVLAKLGGQKEEATNNDVPEGIIKKGF
jgi:hypothetical protein